MYARTLYIVLPQKSTIPQLQNQNLPCCQLHYGASSSEKETRTRDSRIKSTILYQLSYEDKRIK